MISIICQTLFLLLSVRMRDTPECLFCFSVARDIEKIIMDGGIGREGMTESLKTMSAAFLLSSPGYRKTSFTIINASYSRS